MYRISLARCDDAAKPSRNDRAEPWQPVKKNGLLGTDALDPDFLTQTRPPSRATDSCSAPKHGNSTRSTKDDKQMTVRHRLTQLAAAATLACASSPALAAIPEAQQAALRAIFIAADGPNWDEYLAQGWSATGEVSCSAILLHCDDDDNVVGLALSGLPAHARLSRRVSELTELRSLDVYPPFSTALPQSLTKLPKLTSIQIDSDTYAEPIPKWFGDFPALERLYIFYTDISGTIPRRLSNLKTLRTLFIAANSKLSGPIPDNLGNLENLKSLTLAQNQLTGTIPASLGTLDKLEMLDLSNNLLEGDIPASLRQHPNLVFDAEPYWSGNVRLHGNTLYSNDPEAIASPAYAQLSALNQAHDARVTATAYLGDNRASVQWQLYDWGLEKHLDTAELPIGVDHAYAVYARAAEGPWQWVDTVEKPSAHAWQGEVPGLSTNQSVDIQVRRQMGYRGSYKEGRKLAQSSGEQAPAVRIDSSQPPNYPPSFSAQGGPLVVEPGERVEIPAWASNLDDGDGGSQHLVFELKYLSNGELFNGTPSISVPSGTLRFQAAPEAAGESLMVFELCDVPADKSRARACSEPVVFKVSVNHPTAVLPSFSLLPSLSTSLEKKLLSFDGWASDIQDGYSDHTHHLRFETIWVENDELFIRNPWLIRHSGALRMQFAEAAQGRATVYFQLRDQRTGLASKIHSLQLEKRLEIAPSIESNGGRDGTGEATAGGSGGGGSLGWGVLGLLLLRHRREAHLKRVD